MSSLRTRTVVLLRSLFGKRAGQTASVLLLGLLLYLFVGRGMRFFLVPSGSMEPGLTRNDHLITLTEREYERGDIVVIEDPEDGAYFVKRIAAVPKDRVRVYDGALFLNGEYASEPYIAEPMAYAFPEPGNPPVVIPPDHVFVLGDNRNASRDSSVDLVAYPVENIVGKVRYRYFPYDRFGAIDSYPLTNVSGD